MDYREIITIDPAKRGGKPLIRGLRITVSVLTCSFLLAACASEAPPSDAELQAEMDAAEAVVVEFFDAIEAMDFEALEATVTSDFELVEDTLILDMAGFIELLQPYADAGATIEYVFSDFNTEVRGDVAWTRYRNRAVADMEGQEMHLEWLESAVLLKQDEGWKVDRLQSAPVEGEGG